MSFDYKKDGIKKEFSVNMLKIPNTNNTFVF